MSWLNASEYVLMEAAARDRLHELHTTRDRVDERVVTPRPPARRPPGTCAGDGARAPRERAASRPAALERRALFCPGA